MIVVQTGQVVFLMKDMIQRNIGQIRFRPPVIVKRCLQDPAQQRDFVHRLDPRQGAFHLVEQHQEHAVLGHQAIDNRHQINLNCTPATVTPALGAHYSSALP